MADSTAWTRRRVFFLILCDYDEFNVVFFIASQGDVLVNLIWLFIRALTNPSRTLPNEELAIFPFLATTAIKRFDRGRLNHWLTRSSGDNAEVLCRRLGNVVYPTAKTGGYAHWLCDGAQVDRGLR